MRVKNKHLDPLTTQLRVAHMLNAAHLHPGELSPSAVAFIRKLSDPMPGKLQLYSGGIIPPVEWERAVNDRMSQFIRRAARPAHGAVPANAEAVVFADKAELLACLASDWCDGSGVMKWWWQSLFKGTDLSHGVLSAWLDAPEYVPAALELLANSRKVITFARALPTHTALSLLQAVMGSFALRDLESAIDLVLAKIRPAQGSSSKELRAEETTHRLPPQSTFFNPSQGAPWRPWVPESQTSGLHLEQQLFLGIGLMLIRAPTDLRAQAFAPAVLQWHLAIADEARNLSHTSTVPEERDRFLDKHFAPAVKNLPVRLAVKENLAVPPSRDNAGEDNASSRILRPGDTEVPLPNGEVPKSHQRPPISYPAAQQRNEDRPMLRALEVDNNQASAPSEPFVVPIQSPSPLLQNEKGPSLREIQIKTEWGGVFYLINLGLFLNLYGDFTTPRQPGIALPLWDFLALLGLHLVGEKIQSDPVWSLLGQLAGRDEQESPGKGFDPPECWRLPAEWLKSFPEDAPWTWTLTGKRLQVKHPAQFLVLDVPLHDADAPRQLGYEMQAYENITWNVAPCGPAEFPSDTLTGLERWMGWLMPYIRIRLCRALGLTQAENISTVLLAHPARVFVTSTHLDVFFALDELPIEIRLSGLDRNPGWVPAAGRFITFHYE